jgi:aerobic carbon-monoxide dehydrogenase medium subunit
VIPASFDYVRVHSEQEAFAALEASDGDAKVIAGGHSLLPLMKLRFATPATLVDIAALPGLSGVERQGDELVIGALSTHHLLANDPLIAEGAPLLARAAAQVGDPQVRHRGTIGGSVAHGDPASDLPAALIALGATIVARSSAGERRIGIDDFFRSFLEVDLTEHELLCEIRVPVATGGHSFQKFNRRAQDWAIVGVAAQCHADGVRVGLVNMGPTPLRAHATEAARRSGASVEDAAALADEGTEPTSDLNASGEYRRHLARVLTRRALIEAGC